MEQPPGEEDGGDGIEVNPVGGDNGSESADDPVPRHVTEHRGYDTEEQQITQHLEAQEHLPRGEAGHEDVIGNDREEPVEEHLTGDEE